MDPLRPSGPIEAIYSVFYEPFIISSSRVTYRTTSCLYLQGWYWELASVYCPGRMLALLSNHNLFKSSLKVTYFSFFSFSLNKGQSFLKWSLATQKKQDNLPGEGDLEGRLLVYLVTSVAIFPALTGPWPCRLLRSSTG